MAVLVNEGITQAFAPSVNPPNAGSVGAQYLSLLNAFEQGAPQQLSLQQQYQPQYTQADLQNLQESLMGTTASSGQPATPGYLDLYSNDVLPAISAGNANANTITRTANINDLSTLGPSAAGAIKNVNPGASALTDSLTKTATSQLALGTDLDPNAVYQATNPVISNFANRGIPTSGGSQLAQALSLYAGGQNALQTRQNNAATAAGISTNTYTDPTLAMLGINSQAPGQAQSFTATGAGAASGAQPTIMPTSDLESLFSGAYNTNANDAAATANNQSAMFGSLENAEGEVAGAAAGGI